MATYKVLQDIEAEDKLIGPLSLRQFIYAIIVVILCYIMFRLFMVQPLLVTPILPVALLFAVLAAPFGHDQSSEIWLLAKIRFILKPRRRIWDQTGLQELVTITAPKKIEEILTNGLDQTQVKSRLQALAQTIDTRGWAVKGVDVNMYANPVYSQQASDRLVDPTQLNPAAVPDTDIRSSDDILDTTNNPVAQQMDQLVAANDQAHRQAIMNQMQQIRQDAQVPVAQTIPAPMPQPMAAAPAAAVPQVAQTPYFDTSRAVAYGQTPVMNPIPPLAPAPAAPIAPATPMPEPVKPAILELAHNDDLSVATIARQANNNDEVVISLR